MKEYTEQHPIFSESIPITETSDPAHADNVNAAPMQLLQNTLANRKEIEELKKGNNEVEFDDIGNGTDIPGGDGEGSEKIPDPAEAIEQITSGKSVPTLIGHIKTTLKGLVPLSKKALDVAMGRNQARVFATVEAMDEWLAVPENVEQMNVGDNLYITATDVPDYWWDGTQQQPLETQKVDLTGYDQQISALQAADREINGNITALSQKITSFENTKSEIAASGLGAALGLAASNTWAQIVAKIKSIANRGVLNWSGSNTTFAVPAGYYPGGTLDSRPAYNSGYNAGVTAADNRANVNSVNYKTGYNAGVSAGRTLKSKTYTIASETSSSTVYDMDGASHVGWRIAVPAIIDTHCIVGAHWKDSGGNQYDYYLSPDGAISNDPNTYAINIARIPGNTSDWATKTSGTIYLYVDSSKSRSHSITVYYC